MSQAPVKERKVSQSASSKIDSIIRQLFLPMLSMPLPESTCFTSLEEDAEPEDIIMQQVTKKNPSAMSSEGEFVAYNASAVSEAELADEYHDLVAELTATGELAAADDALYDAVDAVPKYAQNFRPGGAAGLVSIVVASLVDKSARCMAASADDDTATDTKELDSVLRRCRKMLATELPAEEREKLKEAMGSCEKKLASLDLERTRKSLAEILKAGAANEFPRGSMTSLEALCVRLGSAVALDTDLVKSFVDAAMSRAMEELRQDDVAKDFLDSLLAGLESVANDVDSEQKKGDREKAKLTRDFMVIVISAWENAALDDGADSEGQLQLDAVGFQRELDGLVRVHKACSGALAEARIHEGDAIYDRFQLLETYKKQGLGRILKRARAAVKSDVAAVTRVYDVAEPWKEGPLGRLHVRGSRGAGQKHTVQGESERAGRAGDAARQVDQGVEENVEENVGAVRLRARQR
jgi:hypothetical protein